MNVVTRISLFIILCGNDHAKDLNSTAFLQGNNATVYIDTPIKDGKTLLEINFSGYTSNQHFTNVVLCVPNNRHNGTISVNSNYTSRIDKVVNNNGHFSFLLLNIIFNDSGNYTVKANSSVKGNTSVLVARRILVAQLQEPIMLSFTFYEKKASTITVELLTSKLSQPVISYNMINNSCTYTNVVSKEKKTIQNCVLRNGEFSFTIAKIVWLHKGSYFAWDDKGRLLDSIFLDIQENTVTRYVTTPNLDKGKVMGTWLMIFALGITILVACLVAVARWKFRIRRARMSTMHNFIYRNGIQTIVCSSSNAYIPKEARNNSKELTDLKRDKFQARVNLKDQNMCVRGLGSAKSSSNANCNLHIDSSLSSAETIQSESAHGYDYVHHYDEIATDCEWKQPYIRSKLLGTNSIGSTSQSSFENNYAAQQIFMTLRPPAPDLAEMKKKKEKNVVADLFNSHKKVNKSSLPRHDPSVLFAKKGNQRIMESHRTRSSDELSLDSIDVVSSPPFVQLEKDFAKKAVDLPQKSEQVMWLRDSKTRSTSQCLSAEYSRDDYDQEYAVERRHRRSCSNDVLYGDRIFNAKTLLSRRFSASICMDKDYYDCLNNS